MMYIDTILANIHVRCNFAQPMFHLIEKFELLHRPWKLQEPMSKTGVVVLWKENFGFICRELIQNTSMLSYAIIFFWQPHFPISSTKNLRGPDDDDAGDVYCNKTALPQGFCGLRKGDKVRYDLRYDNRIGKTYAVNVSVEGYDRDDHPDHRRGDRGLATVVGY